MKEKKALKCRKHPKAPHDCNANYCVFCGKRLHKHPICRCCAAKLDARGEFCQNCGCRRKSTDEMFTEAFKKAGFTEIKIVGRD